MQKHRDWETRLRQTASKTSLTGKDIEHLKVLKTETTEYIQAISGATISSRAVTEDAVRNGVDFLIKTIKDKGTRSWHRQAQLITLIL